MSAIATVKTWLQIYINLEHGKDRGIKVSSPPGLCMSV